ncbi:hypothetical protein RAA17_21570 [Komagataeibacter rhaeticus]|nr:hypothetical protein [Komagataeibacter rhaeticus]
METYRVMIADGRRIPALLDSLADEIGRTFHDHITNLLARALHAGDTPQRPDGWTSLPMA